RGRLGRPRDRRRDRGLSARHPRGRARPNRHGGGSMSDYAFDLRDLMTFSSVSPLDMLREVNPDAVPDPAPPAAANYRTADLQGVSCAVCAKFVVTGFAGEGEASVPKGYCSLWESLVSGDHVSDGFADPGPAFDGDGKQEREIP